jgi:hypothetical protein
MVAFVSPSGGFWPVFFQGLFQFFWSQIYSTLLFFSRHAPLSLVLRRRPFPLPEARVTSFFGYRRVACTRQRGLCSLVRVKATLHHFMAVLVGDGGYGGGSTAGCSWWWRVFPTCRRLRWILSLSPLPIAMFVWSFLHCVVVYPLVAMYSLAVYYSDFIRIFDG